jgi:hypothetical protein
VFVYSFAQKKKKKKKKSYFLPNVETKTYRAEYLMRS